MEAWHILDEEVSKMVLIHQPDEQAERFFFGHLIMLARTEKRGRYVR